MVVSPADGRVTDVTPLDWLDHFRGPAVRIGIYLSLFNVHVNRCPVAGTAVWVRYAPGRFLDSRRPAAARVNESIETLFEHDDCPGRLCLVRQIAGAFASRVVTTVRPGQRFPAGHKIGMIKFGSRTELYLSDPRAVVLVRPGDVVRGGLGPGSHPVPGPSARRVTCAPFARCPYRSVTVMRFAILFAAAAAVLVCQPAAASYPCGIYARIDKVELGPDETKPQWIKIHGDFILVKTSGRLSEPERGFMYFSLVAGKEDLCRLEWADLKALAKPGAFDRNCRRLRVGAHRAGGQAGPRREQPERPQGRRGRRGDPVPAEPGPVPPADHDARRRATGKASPNPAVLLKKYLATHPVSQK